jgi:hypothetical protein
MRLFAPGLGLPLTETDLWWARLMPSERGLERAHLLARLERMPGQHLVIVRYGPESDPGKQIEWVYNRADIDRAKVIWAREMGDAENTRLLDYYRHRRVWLIDADRQPVQLQPYLGRTGTNGQSIPGPQVPSAFAENSLTEPFAVFTATDSRPARSASPATSVPTYSLREGKHRGDQG